MRQAKNSGKDARFVEKGLKINGQIWLDTRSDRITNTREHGHTPVASTREYINYKYKDEDQFARKYIKRKYISHKFTEEHQLQVPRKYIGCKYTGVHQVKVHGRTSVARTREYICCKFRAFISCKFTGEDQLHVHGCTSAASLVANTEEYIRCAYFGEHQLKVHGITSVARTREYIRFKYLCKYTEFISCKYTQLISGKYTENISCKYTEYISCKYTEYISCTYTGVHQFVVVSKRTGLLLTRLIGFVGCKEPIAKTVQYGTRIWMQKSFIGLLKTHFEKYEPSEKYDMLVQAVMNDDAKNVYKIIRQAYKDFNELANASFGVDVSRNFFVVDANGDRRTFTPDDLTQDIITNAIKRNADHYPQDLAKGDLVVIRASAESNKWSDARKKVS
ncbi:hypothetical protein DPMN_015834 [Dreissena polymorpha]|uniref:Uncharacterized protein n=1 Tax=Dreissena polymorpha TaxID=45954 RepID=A0A9D4NC13_DREPO|nr:hypothetical protein DPMN_015834 [Dreissena polymorpha]